MKKSLLKKLAVITGAAIAFSSFAVMTTACSDKNDKDDTKVEDDEDEDEDEDEDKAEETEAEETEAEETEAEDEDDDIVIDEIEEIDEEIDDEAFPGTVDASSFTNEEVAAYAQTYTDLGYMLMGMDETDAAEGIIEGFIGIGGDEETSISISNDEASGSGSMTMVVVALFEDADSASTYLNDAMSEFSESSITETDNGTTYYAEETGVTLNAELNNDGVLFMEEVLDFGAMTAEG